MSDDDEKVLLLSVVPFLCENFCYFVFEVIKLNYKIQIMRFNRIRENKMTITLEQTYLDTATRKQEIERELSELEETLRSPERTLDDIIRHITLLKEYRQYQ